MAGVAPGGMPVDAGRGPEPWLSVWHLALLLPWVVLGIVARAPIRDNSFLWHVRAGTVQLDRGAVITADPFSFTALGRPWRTQSWLVELGYGWLERRFGLSYVSWMVLIVGGVFLVALAVLAYRYLRRPSPLVVYLVLTSVMAAGFLNPRPVIFSYALFALVVLADDDRRLRWSLPVLFWAWAAIHGSFVVGGAYVLLQAVRRREWHRWRELAVIGVVVTVTAHGLGVWQMLLAFFQGREALANITEWAHPNLISVPLAPLFLGIVGLVVAGIRGRLALRDLWVIVPFLALALSSNRSVIPAWIALTPFIVRSLEDLQVRVRRLDIRQARVNVAAAVIVVVLPFLVPLEGGISDEVFPVEAVTHLEGERLFHDDGTGGYLIYSQWPDRLVYIDDRAELFHRELPEFVEARGGRAVWRDVFDRYGIDEVLLRDGDPLLETLRLAGWSEAFRDDTFVLMRPG